MKQRVLAGIESIARWWNRRAAERDRERWSPPSRDDRYVRATNKITDFAKLRRNWDGEGAEPIAPSVIERAVRALEELRADQRMPAPSAAATPDGGVLISWSVPAGRDELDTLDIEAILSGERDELLIGYADRPGSLFEGSVREPHLIAARIREVLKRYLDVSVRSK